MTETGDSGVATAVAGATVDLAGNINSVRFVCENPDSWCPAAVTKWPLPAEMPSETLNYCEISKEFAQRTLSDREVH